MRVPGIATVALAVCALGAPAANPPQEARDPAALQPREREGQQSLWWYLLLIAFAFLAIETFFANRISTAWRR